ncbi:exonuclease II [Pisolithus tinctorius]|nr:exonuclease II [Pisolithus tinctorius]
MGIPKFFRYISERYPLTSQLIQENKIPEFDNLYLDFNGIIHNCSHPNDEDAHFRMSEEQIFTSIFAYVDLLFGKIKPKKLFFMAVDGVAPRAKMNQQRSRRFRTAKEAREVREMALAKGQKLPDEKAFDSNCITPGTEFMAKLSNQLRYFINKKITEDADWREVEVVLSGHEVPGEGEHKIMEYIRLSRAQPDYNPNIRHCLYGLDADLVMLGLLSHDPHFCLLREEVKFGPAAKKKNGRLEAQNFYLLHLSLIREYLNLEFHDIAPELPFGYSLEQIIDDFVLLAVFVGNDFLPNLPDLHIHENGLERLFEVYKKVLPSLDGYLNDGGTINMKRLQRVLDEMGVWEREVFEKEYADLSWFKGKQRKHVKEMEVESKQSKLVLTRTQRKIFDEVKEFVLSNRGSRSINPLTMPNTFPARDRKFISKLSEDLHLLTSWDEYDDDDQNLIILRLPDTLREPIPDVDDEEIGVEDKEGEGEWEDVPEEEDEEALLAVDRVLAKYEKADVADGDEGGSFDNRYEASIQEKLTEWKRNYYRDKLGISYDDAEEMGALVRRYVEGLQWVMHYYYGGVASWGWFYDYHYAPRISDLRSVEDMSFHFELGTPFRPFEQLMGVLPAASRDLIPLAYRDLMDDPYSPIFDFYPAEFETDLNGKKQEWEAIVKIPFIDQNRLLRAMSSREHRLTDEERQRNQFGTSTRFVFKPGEPTVYPSSLPHFFPPIYRCTCKMEPFDLPTLDGLHLVPGLREGVALGTKALAGFPSLETLPHTGQIGFHGVNVHGTESRNKSVILHIENPHEDRKIEEIAKEMVGKRTFVGWPFLREGLVEAVSDSMFKYEQMVVVPGSAPRIVANPHSAPQGLSHWKSKAKQIQHVYSKRGGVITGDVNVLVHVRPLKGMKRLDNGSFKKDYEGPENEIEQAVQMVISEVHSEDPRFLETEPVSLAEEFPEGCKIFFLGEHAYGVAAQVAKTVEDTLSVILAFFPSDKQENEKFKAIVEDRVSHRYYPSYKAAAKLDISGRALARVTSSFMVLTSDSSKENLGLSLKFDAKSLKVIDYSRKNGRHWEFSEKAIDLIREYKTKFPEVFEVLDDDTDDMARASDIFSENADAGVRQVKTWLKSKGVRDFEPVSLYSDQLTKETVKEIETFADSVNKKRSHSAIRKAMVKGIPRHAVLKPSHAIYRLQNQHFELGDRVTMVQDSGGVPLAAKGVVIGINAKTMDVAWDVPFISGVTLGDRCSQYRGSTVPFTSCLNLTNPQFVASTHPKSEPPPPPTIPFRPRPGTYPAIRPPPGQAGASGFRPAPPPSQRHTTPVAIMTNPNRARNGVVNGRSQPDANNAQSNEHFAPPYNHRVPSQGPRTSANGNNYHSPFHGQRPPPSRSPVDRFASGHTTVRQVSVDKPSLPSQPGNHHPLRGSAHGHGSTGYPHSPRGMFTHRGGRGGPSSYDRGRGRGFRGRGRGGPYVPPVRSS